MAKIMIVDDEVLERNALKVILKNLTITTPKIDMYWPFMTSTFY